jgi:hypothetical protein
MPLLDMAVGLEYTNDSERYTGRSIATIATRVGHVKVEGRN